MTDSKQPGEQPERPRRRRVAPRDKHGERVPPKKLVTAARALLAQNMTPGDIKRQLAETYGMKPRSFERYIATARQRNREAIGRTADEAKSDSVSFWASKQQTAERAVLRDQARLQEALRRLDEANAILGDEDELTEKREAAQITANRCVEESSGLRKSIFMAQRDSYLCQQMVDKLLGNLAPAKVAHTDSSGNDVAPAGPVYACEPTNVSYAQDIVMQVMTTLEPLGLYIVDRSGHRMRSDGTFDTATIVEAPPDPLPAQPTPRLLAPRGNYPEYEQ